jgi:putative oxidoreductase
VRPTHPPPARDAALLLARLALGTIMVAHACQQLGGLTGLEQVSIPVAIVSASVVTVVEIVCGLLVVAGLLTPAVAASTGVVLVGAAAYVQVLDGVAGSGGWQLVGAVVVALAALAAAGPGRFGVVHLLRSRRSRSLPGRAGGGPAGASHPVTPHAAYEFFDGPVPPAGLPLLPLVRLTAAPEGERSPGPVE